MVAQVIRRAQIRRLQHAFWWTPFHQRDPFDPFLSDGSISNRSDTVILGIGSNGWISDRKCDRPVPNASLERREHLDRAPVS
jgi:hypothetical protein